MIGKIFKKAASRTDVSVEVPVEDLGAEDVAAEGDVDVAVKVSGSDVKAAARGVGKLARGLKKDDGDAAKA